MSNNRIKMVYRNYRGEIALREVLPIQVYFGSTEYHQEPQFLLKAFDFAKQDIRDFALCDCDFAGHQITQLHHDFITHSEDWRNALTECFDNSEGDDRSYWKSQLTSFDSVMQFDFFEKQRPSRSRPRFDESRGRGPRRNTRRQNGIS